VLCASAHLLCQQGPLALNLCAGCLDLLARVIKLAREGRQAATPLLKLATVLIQLSSGSLSQVASTESLQPMHPKCMQSIRDTTTTTLASACSQETHPCAHVPYRPDHTSVKRV